MGNAFDSHPDVFSGQRHQLPVLSRVLKSDFGYIFTFYSINKRYGKDKFLFVFFTIIFLFMAYFLTAKQVRYILPVLPFLSIIAVMGIKDILDKLEERTNLSSLRFWDKIKSTARVFIFASVAILLIFNFIYLRDQIETINPFSYVLGKETREAFSKASSFALRCC